MAFARFLVRLTLASLALTAALPAHGKTTVPIALTFDDLPALTQVSEQSYVEQTNKVLLKGLRHHHFPAIGFVNEGKLDDLVRPRQIAILRQWLRAGMDLGNHTFSHESPNTLGADGYVGDIARGEPVTRRLLRLHGKTLRWFRHPYLETGTPEAVRARIDTWLHDHGYRVAPVTIDADDWEFAEPYDDAVIRRDEARRHQIRAEYLAHTAATIDWYRQAARALFGRDIAYVMLLHDTRLNADCIDELAAILRKRQLRPVTLDAAMRDPAYLTPDHYAGHDGIEWIERWSQTLDKELPWDSYEDVPKDIHDAYDRIDSDRDKTPAP